MIRNGLKRQLYCVRSAARMSTSSLPFHNDPTSPTPLVEHYRSSWPDPTNPADFKVSMKVLLSDLPFQGEERAIFTRMVGSRLNHGKQELTLVAEVFPNRMENRKFLLVQLERLLLEAKALHAAREYE
ncbi:hypothetical protein B484DRAFT_400107 [Ochromonadaceae sp. CCMP2298]|nr:hypothetical protein B484DRAFT_400107 [Ochromonadaceae sp. CCMP2298]